MPPVFDHERLKVYHEAIRFVGWVSPYPDDLPAKVAARDQLDRASTSVPLNLAEGNAKRSYAERCRYFEIARGSGVECAACLDVLVAKGKLSRDVAAEGKEILLEIVSMASGLISRFSSGSPLEEEAGLYLPAELALEKE
jgi:four helix bundle protein